MTRDSGTGAKGRYSADQVANTQLVIGMLQQATTVRDDDRAAAVQPDDGAGARRPQRRQADVRQASGQPGPYVTGSTAAAMPPLILDGWGNPIIFVPAGGLCGADGAKTDPDVMIVGGKAGDTDSKKVVSKDPAQALLPRKPARSAAPTTAPSGPPPARTETS